MEISANWLEELFKWLQTEAAFYWQSYWDETAARQGSWDNPLDREHLWDLKYKAEALDQFALQIEGVLSEGKGGIKLEELSELLKEFAEDEGEKELAFAHLLIKRMSQDRLPTGDELKDILKF